MKRIIGFTKPRILMFMVSIVLITGMSAFTFIKYGGFNFGIDFKPGLIIQVNINAENVSDGDVKNALSGLNVEVQNVGRKDEPLFNIRISEVPGVENFREQSENDIQSALKSVFGSGNVSIVSTEFVGARMSSSISKGTIIFTTIALILILVYTWIRFHLNFAVSAMLATLHDTVFMLAFIGAFQIEFNTGTIAALLTIIGYSLNDTIVVFDRIRENTNIIKEKTFAETIDISITQSLSRTIITSLTTLLAIIAIVIFGRGSVRLFAVNMIVGIVVGTYSSIFIASNIVLSWQNAHAKHVKKKLQKNVKTGSKTLSIETATVETTSKPKKAANTVKQSAEDIAKATEDRKKAKAKKKKKKK